MCRDPLRLQEISTGGRRVPRRPVFGHLGVCRSRLNQVSEMVRRVATMKVIKLPVRRVESAGVVPTTPAWPWGIPAVRQLLADGMDLGDLTVLVGENGAGKSTLVEGIAMAYGLNAEGGGTGSMHRTAPTESPLHDHLQIVGASVPNGGISSGGKRFTACGHTSRTRMTFIP